MHNQQLGPWPWSTPRRAPLPRGQEVADRAPGADEDLGLMAPQDSGFVGWDLDVPVYFCCLHWFRMTFCGRKQRPRGEQRRRTVSLGTSLSHSAVLHKITSDKYS